jgi:drug/metabolite transporter (DMT)-like permease
MLGGVGPLAVEQTLFGVLLAIGAMVAISIMSLTIRIGTTDDEHGPLNVLFVVLLTNVSVLVPAALVLHVPDLGLTIEALWAFALAGITGTLIARVFTYTSIRRIGSSRTEPIKSSQPLHATLIAVVVLNETVPATRIVGIVLIVVGVGIVSWEVSRGSVDRRVNANAYELLLPLLGALFYGIEPTFAKIGFAEGTPVLPGLAIKTLAALFGYVAYMVARGSVPNPVSFDARQRRWYLLAGLCNTTFLVFYYFALEVTPVSVVVPIVTTSPVAVVVLSRLFLPRLEQITWRIAAGAVVVVAGGVLTTLFG